MSKDDYFNGEDYVTLDGGIKDNNDYPSSNNDVSGSHHEETKENYPSGNSTIQETQVTQVPFSTPEIKIPFKGLSKFIFFNKKNVKKEDPLNSLVYDSTIPILGKLEIIDKTREKLEAEDIDRVKQLKTIDEKIEQTTKNRDQLEKDLQIARVAKDKSNSDLAKAEQEFLSNFKSKMALRKQERILEKELSELTTIKPDSFVKIEFILSETNFTNIIKLDLSCRDMDDFGAKLLADAIANGRLSNLKGLDVSGNLISNVGEEHFINVLELLQTQDIAVILKKITETGAEAIKEVIDFTLKGLKYAVDQHAKNQGLIEADTIAIYGGKHCEQALSTSVKVISMGLIKECGKHPEIVKILQQGVWQAKVVAGLSLFSLTVGNNMDSLATPEMMRCIGALNKDGLGDISIDDVTQLTGESNDCTIF